MRFISFVALMAMAATAHADDARQSGRDDNRSDVNEGDSARAEDTHRNETAAVTHDSQVLPLSVILERVRPITGDKVLDVEVAQGTVELAYGIYYLDPNGRRHEIYVDARTGEVILQMLDH